MGTEAKAYLQEHYIPQLFEGLMTGLIYNRPDDPITFLEEALTRVRGSPNEPFAWDMFINKDEEPKPRPQKSTPVAKQNTATSKSETPATAASAKSRPVTKDSMVLKRVPSVIKAAEVAHIPDVPIILFMGGPGGGKTKIAAKVYNALADKGLIHVCMPDVVRNALSKYKDKYPEWREANDKYLRGELIPNHLALSLVKAEMGRHSDASAFFLEGFPREARQVEDFERQVKPVNMAMILDYDERTLREHMERRGLGMEIIDQKIKEFKQKTLPSAKYFDDQKLLHLIPGEKDEGFIFDRMRYLVQKAMEGGVAVVSNPPTASHAREQPTANGRATAEPVRETPHTTRSSRQSVNKTPSVERAPKTPQSKQGRRSQTPRSRGSVEVPRNEGNDREPETPPTRRDSSRRSQRDESATGRRSSRKSQREESKENQDVSTDDQTPKPTSSQSRTTAMKVPSIDAVIPPTANDTRAQSTRSFKGLPHNAPVILIIGAPGSNKNELASRIAKKYDGYVLLSMSDLLRKKIVESRGDELWERIGKKMDQGEQVPMKACREVLYTAIQEHQGTSWGYVVVGYPRNQTQAADFESVIGRLDVAILIDCTEQFCTKNIADRYERGQTTGTHRPDDTLEVFKIRMGFFKQNTLPMLKYLDDKSKLRVVRADTDTVDGDADEEKIFNDITSAIDNALLIDGEASGSSLESAKNN